MRERRQQQQPTWSKALSLVLAVILIAMGIGLFYGYTVFQKLTNFGSGSQTTTSTTSAITIRVPEDAKTLSEALTQADDGDTIVLAAGTYSDPIVDNGLNVGVGIHKALTIQGAGRDKTILDGKLKSQHGIYIPQIDKKIVVKDMTVQNFAGNGAEIYGANVTVSGVTFKNNQNRGVALHFSSRESVFKNNIITGSKFTGLYTEKAAVQIFNNTLVGNGDTGIHIVVADTDPAGTAPTIYNNIVGVNTSYGILYEHPAFTEKVTVDHNDVYGNKNNYFENLNNEKTKTRATTPKPGTGSLSAVPQFADTATYKLAETSTLKTAGREGAEIGAYGGLPK